MSWSVFGKAFLCETVYAIPFFILSILPLKAAAISGQNPDSVHFYRSAAPVLPVYLPGQPR